VAANVFVAEVWYRANIEFPLPASFIWDMFVRVLPDIPKQSAFNKKHELEADVAAAWNAAAR
jgi:exonuclease V gamma subunit